MTIDRDLVAAALPGYEVGGELGRGGWGVVLEGRHRQLQRDVAIKQLPAAFAADPAVRARFVAEARVLASIDHPHVVPIYDYIEREDVCLLVMEKLPGGTVWRQFTTSGLTMPEVCAIVMATCSGLHAAHQRGILHRDIKPENLLFSSSKTLKVTDFGIAKVLAGSETKATRAGEVLGTPAYMAPEQVQNRALTPATDVYAVGVMLYELLSGRLPFASEDPIALLFCQVNDVPPPLNEVAPAVPGGLAKVVMRALAKRPDERYSTTEDFGVALGEAATESWEPGWLQKSDLPVMGTGRMAAVTQQAQGAGAEGEQVQRATRPHAPPTIMSADEGTATSAGASTDPTASRTRPASAAPPVDVPSAVIRPDAPGNRARGAVAADLDNVDLVGIEEVVKLPPIPTTKILSALGFLLVCLAIAFIGLGAPSTKANNIPPGTVTIAGVDPATAPLLRLDLKQPVPVTGKLPPAAAGADRVKLSFSVGGVPLGQVQSTLGSPPLPLSLDASGFRYVIASRTTTQLSFEGGGKTLAQTTFKVRTDQSAFLTVPGALSIALVLFALAYIESLLRALRRRRKRIIGPVGLLVMGGLVGVIAVVWAWLVAAKEPTVIAAVVCALLGAVSGISAAMAAIQMGRRQRMRTGR